MAALALEFTILTAARTGEAIRAQWSEVDLEAKVWTVPAQRMKAGREHRVPLSAPAVAVLKKLAKAKTGPFIFPAGKGEGHLSQMALLMMLRRMEAGRVTVHGFRSTFRDWCGEATNFPRELAEEALAHKIGDAVERAYRRGDALEKRRALMESWAAYCQPKRENIVPLARPA
jgi:integrase